MLFRAFAVLALLLLPQGPAAAQALDAPLASLGSTNFDEIERGIAGVAASGDPRAAVILEAMGEGRLLMRTEDKAILIKARDGSLTEAATGNAAPGDAATRPVRVNNRLRRALDAAVGGLTLLSPDPARRLEAAGSVYRSRDSTFLPTIEKALDRENDPGVRQALTDARSAILLVKTDAPEDQRIAAVGNLAARGDQEALVLLQTLPSDAPPALRGAVQKAVAGIEGRLRIIAVAQNAAQGISLGSVLLLAAIGLAITFGVMGVINMAHGEMVMLGAYVTFLVQEFCRTYWPGGLEAALLIALPLAFLVTAAFGVLIERTIIRQLYGRPLETLLATWGLSLILQQLVRTIFGPTNQQVSAPSWMSGTVQVVPGFDLTLNRLVIVGFSLAVFALIVLVIRYSRFGLEMRAVVQNRRMAASMGIRTAWVDAFTFALGSGIAGIAGVALSQIDNVSPNLGQSYIIDSFMVVVFGGVGNLWGTLTAALTLGIANKILEPVAGPVLGKILVLVAIILFIQKRPKGLFAPRGRALEA